MNKKLATNLVKNKTAMQRIRNKRLAKNAMTLKKNMTLVGERPKAKVLSFTKKVSPKKIPPKKVSPKKVSPKKVSPKKASPKKNNDFGKSIHAYKYLVAIPYAISGLHNPRSPGYHNELVKNLKNYQKYNPALVSVHNKNWALNQIKRNVYKVLNKKKSSTGNKPIAVSTRYQSLTKTKKLIKNRKIKKTKPTTDEVFKQNVKDSVKKFSINKKTIAQLQLKNVSIKY